MRVCFVSHSAGQDGAELSLLDLVDGLRRRNVEVSCLLPHHGELEESLAGRGVETTVIAYKHWVGRDRSHGKLARRLFRNGLALRPLVRAIRRSGCDVVCTNTVATPAGAVAAKLASRPHVWYVREYGDLDHALCFDFGIRLSRRLIGHLSDACIANSNAIATEYEAHLGRLVPDVVYNAVDLEPPGEGVEPEVPWRHPGAIRCMVLSRVHPRKGQQDAVRAMMELAKTNTPAELMLVGGSSHGYDVTLRGIIRDLGLSDRIHVLPFAARPLPILNTADVVLVCSRKEAFGRVAVEAMKLGKPVIGTRSGGTPEVVRHGATGFLYEPGDSGELAARIRDLHENPTMRAAMGSEGRRVASERYTSARYAADVERVLRRVIERSSKR